MRTSLLSQFGTLHALLRHLDVNLKMSPEEKALNEAKSRIYWGAELDEVNRYLVDTGLFEQLQAKKLTARIAKKRNKEARAEGMVRISKGIVLVVFSGGLTYGYIQLKIPHYIGKPLALISIGIGIFGLYVFSRGVEFIFRPRFRDFDD